MRNGRRRRTCAIPSRCPPRALRRKTCSTADLVRFPKLHGNAKITFARSQADMFFQHFMNGILLILRSIGLSPMHQLPFRSSCPQMKRDQVGIGKQVCVSSRTENTETYCFKVLCLQRNVSAGGVIYSQLLPRQQQAILPRATTLFQPKQESTLKKSVSVCFRFKFESHLAKPFLSGLPKRTRAVRALVRNERYDIL